VATKVSLCFLLLVVEALLSYASIEIWVVVHLLAHGLRLVLAWSLLNYSRLNGVGKKFQLC